MVNDLNVVVLTGRVTRDPDLDKTKRGTMVCSFAIATYRCYHRDDGARVDETSYVDVTTWGTQAERCGAHLTRGMPVRLTGRMKQERWVDGEGTTRQRLVIVADNVTWPEARDDAVTDPEPATAATGPELGD